MTRTVAALAAAIVLLSAGCRPPSPTDRLEGRLDEVQVPAVLEFTFQTGGSDVGRCFQPHATFSGRVDHRRNVIVLRSDQDPGPTAVVTTAGTFVRSELFESPPAPGWLRLPPSLSPAEQVALRQALGIEFAGQLADGLDRPTPVDIVRAAVEVAGSVTQSADTSTFTIEVDNERLDAAADKEQDPGGENGVESVVVTFRARAIERIEVRPALPDDEPPEDEVARGWVTTFARGDDVEVPVLEPVHALTNAEVQAIRPSRIASCRLRG